ncbi:MAG: hypothetical protein WC943_12965, partial [Elusimicrobiota bacterium]
MRRPARKPGRPFGTAPSWLMQSQPVMPVNVYPPGMATPSPVLPMRHGSAVQPKTEPWKPLPKGAGPEMPPVLVSFPDTYEAVVKAYLMEAAAKNDGDFLVKDEVTSHLHRLTLESVPKDRIVYLSREEAFTCVAFKGASGERIDLDIYVRRSGIGEWSVSKIYLHKIDGKPRFVYGPNYQPMTPEAAAIAAAAEAAAAPARRASAPAKAEAAPAVPKPEKPAKLSLQVAFREPSGNAMLDGGERAVLSAAVFNAGPGPAYQVRLTPVLQSKTQAALPAFVDVGDVKAGGTASAEVPIEASAALATGKVQVRLEAREGNGFDAEPVLVEFKARAFQSPRLEVAGVSVGPGKTVRAGEPMKLAVSVRNAGPGPAEAVAAFLVTGSADVFISGEPSASVGELKPGQAKTVEFEFFVNKRYKDEGALPLTVTLSEARGRYGLNAAPLGLVLGKAPPAMKVVSFEGREAAAESEPEAAASVDDVDIPPKAATKALAQAFGVVIGIEAYRDLPAVEYAGRDAEAMYA